MATERQVQMFTVDEMVAMLPVIVSDMKHENDAGGRKLTNENIRRSLYFHVIRTLYDEKTFAHQEPLDAQQGLFIKGYVRDVWAYLEVAYDLIHKTDFQAQYAQLIAVSD